MNWEELMKEYKMKDKEIRLLEQKLKPLEKEVKQRVLKRIFEKEEKEIIAEGRKIKGQKRRKIIRQIGIDEQINFNQELEKEQRVSLKQETKSTKREKNYQETGTNQRVSSDQEIQMNEKVSSDQEIQEDQKLQRKQNIWNFHGKKSYRVATILLVLLLIFPVRAGATLIMNGNLKNLWKEGDHTKVSIMEINQSITKGSYSVTLKQAAGDKQGAYLLFEVTAPQGVVFQNNTWFEEVKVDLEGSSGGFYMQEIADENINDNRGSFLLNVARNEGVTDYPMKINLKGLCQAEREGEQKILSNAQWEFETTLHYDTDVKEYKMRKEVHLSREGKAIIKKVKVSPISIELVIQRGRQRILSLLFPEQLKGSKTSKVFSNQSKRDEGTGESDSEFFGDNIEIRLKDGTILKDENIRDGEEGSKGITIYRRYYFDQIFDPDNVDVIVLGGQEIELK